jgi:hypothetical protein
MAVSEMAAGVLEEMRENGTFEEATVAKILSQVGENGRKVVTDDYLLACAAEIQAAAGRFILLMNAMQGE